MRSSSSFVKSVESAEDLLKNTRLTRASSCPLDSRAGKVFSNIGASRLRVIAEISRSCSAIPCSNASS